MDVFAPTLPEKYSPIRPDGNGNQGAYLAAVLVGMAEAGIGLLVLDETVAKTRIDKRATSISVLTVIGIRRNDQKILLSLRNMSGESKAAWRQFVDDLDSRGLKLPEFISVNGAPGFEAALAELWPDAPAQRRTVHKHRNLLAHPPKNLHDELTENYRSMIYTPIKAETEKHRKALPHANGG